MLDKPRGGEDDSAEPTTHTSRPSGAYRIRMSQLGAARAILARSMSPRPLIAICGTTGVGKSKLAIELALALAKERYGGYQGARIINADAMQVYAGIDILTNKVPAEEQCGVEHLLMGFRHPGEQYVVGQWVKDAMRAVCQFFQSTRTNFR